MLDISTRTRQINHQKPSITFEYIIKFIYPFWIQFNHQFIKIYYPIPCLHVQCMCVCVSIFDLKLMNCIFCFFFFLIFFYTIIVPSKPLNLTVLEVTSTTITIGWRDPENLNGAIVGYRVFYIHQNQTYFATVRSGTGAGEMIRYDLCDLSKYFIDACI